MSNFLRRPFHLKDDMHQRPTYLPTFLPTYLLWSNILTYLPTGFMFLWSGDEDHPRGYPDGADWLKSVIGLDGVFNQPTSLVGWISGKPARLDTTEITQQYQGIISVQLTSCLTGLDLTNTSKAVANSI